MAVRVVLRERAEPSQLWSSSHSPRRARPTDGGRANGTKDSHRSRQVLGEIAGAVLEQLSPIALLSPAAAPARNRPRVRRRVVGESVDGEEVRVRRVGDLGVLDRVPGAAIVLHLDDRRTAQSARDGVDLGLDDLVVDGVDTRRRDQGLVPAAQESAEEVRADGLLDDGCTKILSSRMKARKARSSCLTRLAATEGVVLGQAGEASFTRAAQEKGQKCQTEMRKTSELDLWRADIPVEVWGDADEGRDEWAVRRPEVQSPLHIGRQHGVHRYAVSRKAPLT